MDEVVELDVISGEKLRTKLRVGVLVDSDQIPSWAHKMLDRIVHGDYAEVVLVVKNGASGETSRSILERIRTRRRLLIYTALNYVDAQLSKLDPDPSELRDFHQLLPDVPYITVKPDQKSASDCFEAHDVDKIRSRDLDVIVKLGFRILSGEILACSKYGVWSYHFGDNRTSRGGPPGFWEVLQGCPVTGSMLEILTEDEDAGTVLYRSYSQTDRILVHRNLASLYWKSLSFLPRALELLNSLGAEEFFRRVARENQHPIFYSGQLYSAPTNIQLIKPAAKRYAKYLFKRIRGIFHFEQWIMLFRFDPHGGRSSSFWRFAKLIPPKDRFWADPFAIHENGLYYVFFEEFLYSSGKAHISYSILDSNGNFSTPATVIDRPYHMSYPFIFRHQNCYYMVPETAENMTIDLYKCTEFPGKWQFVRTLIHDVSAVDTTLLNENGKWWLFANVRENRGASSYDELFLFYASDLFSDQWTPHPTNPIISDVRSARPAGAIFSHNGNFYRPSQNNSVSYGNGININQIVVLSEREYREVCVSQIDALWDSKLVGCHTLNHDAGLTVIDGLIKRPRYFS